MKILLRIIISLFLVLLVACTTLPKRDANNHSLIVYKIYTIGMLSESFDCSIKIKNIETNQIYTTQHILKTKGYSFLGNIPNGKYKIIELKIPFANVYFIVSFR